mgnify:CR=1 FL=1
MDMPTVNISLPESLKTFVDEQVATRGYASVSEYFRDVLRIERDRLHLRELLLEGAHSGEGDRADDDYFKALRASVQDPAQ